MLGSASGTQILIAALGSIIPALVWLAFWLLEDRCEPEPKWRILLTFLLGMAAVRVVLPIEQDLSLVLGSPHIAAPLTGAGVVLLIAWAATEELFKFGAAAVFGLMSRAYDEPLDALVYMITAALGFAAGENTLYLLGVMTMHSGMAATIVEGDLRFAGSTLLHTLASGVIGLSLAFAFYRQRGARILAILVGVILAIALHTVFNFFILDAGSGQIVRVFIPLWLGIALVLLLIERIKRPERDYC